MVGHDIWDCAKELWVVANSTLPPINHARVEEIHQRMLEMMATYMWEANKQTQILPLWLLLMQQM